MSYPEIIINGQSLKLIPLGDCACGCRRKTNIPKKSCVRDKRVKNRPMKYLSGHCGSNWKGGKTVINGYIAVQKPIHPRADSRGYVYEHILIAEKALGKYLPPKAEVHHLNGKKNDNSRGNHVICQDRIYHKLIERRTRAYYACGHSHWRKCQFCQTWDDPINLYISPNGRKAYHKPCRH